MLTLAEALQGAEYNGSRGYGKIILAEYRENLSRYGVAGYSVQVMDEQNGEIYWASIKVALPNY